MLHTLIDISKHIFLLHLYRIPACSGKSLYLYRTQICSLTILNTVSLLFKIASLALKEMITTVHC